MPLTRSCDNLSNLNIEDRSNRSFFVDIDDNSNPSGSRPVTRSMAAKSRSDIPPVLTDDLNTTNTVQISSLEETRIQELISESLNSFRTEITSEIGVMLRNFEVSSNSRTQQSRTPEILNQTQSYANRESRTEDIRNQSNSRGISFVNENSDKVLNIIRNWRIKFSGRSDDIDVDEFIYRVNILASNTLNGNYEILCNHAYSIFEGKALDWFWKYHQRNNVIEWVSLTNALRRQYKSDYSDFDIRDDIRRRKQKQNETFDDYLESVVVISDKLKTPMSDQELCETVLRNLKPEIRHELLHVNITQISDLRREVRKHEKFMNDIRISNSYRNFNTKRQIAEIDFESQQLDVDEEENNVDICAINRTITCWNCDEIGHVYKDCVKDRKVFCYGCGLKDMYKPNCIKCKIQGNLKKDVPHQKRGHPNNVRKN